MMSSNEPQPADEAVDPKDTEKEAPAQTERPDLMPETALAAESVGVGAEAEPAAEGAPDGGEEPESAAEPEAEEEAFAKEMKAFAAASGFEETDEADEADEPPAPPAAVGETKKKRERHPPRSDHRRHRQRQWRTAEVVARFAACDRCSYFLSGYRSILEPEALQTAVSEAQADWLPLACTPPVRQLLAKSYGVRVDLDDYYVEGACPSCRRAFVYWAETEEMQADLQISL